MEAEADAPLETTVGDRGERRLWFRRLLTVVRRPAEVFEALRDDSDAAADERSEPMLLVLLIAGIAGTLALSFTGTLQDNTRADAGPLPTALIPAWAFAGGAVYGIALYWVGAALLWLGFRSADSVATFRQTRHVFGYSLVPFAASIVLVPIRLGLFGTDMFRTGGSDTGWPAAVFTGLALVFVAWSTTLVVIGTRTLHDWSWPTTARAVVVALIVPVVVVVVTVL